ncbi:MAG TPA: hypothetical protein VHR45_15540 [Thermoanaerobaculia bacterium]|nr:hypothetical protein [Thermoanaerobaculia bacterium]
MSRRTLLVSRTLVLAALLAALPASAHAAPWSIATSDFMAAPADRPGPLARIWSALWGLWEKEGASIDPNGSPAPRATSGGTVKGSGVQRGLPHANGAGSRCATSDDSGASIDPHG